VPFSDLIIKEADNGFILTSYLDGSQSQMVIECGDDEDKETLTKLMAAVAEHFSSYETRDSKFSNGNLNITWDKEGSHYISIDEAKKIHNKFKECSKIYKEAL
jgi:hypothetical protein